MLALAAYSALGDDWRLPVLGSNVQIGLLPSDPGCAPDLALLRANRANRATRPATPPSLESLPRGLQILSWDQ